MSPWHWNNTTWAVVIASNALRRNCLNSPYLFGQQVGDYWAQLALESFIRRSPKWDHHQKSQLAPRLALLIFTQGGPKAQHGAGRDAKARCHPWRCLSGWVIHCLRKAVAPATPPWRLFGCAAVSSTVHIFCFPPENRVSRWWLDNRLTFRSRNFTFKF